jgi:hypothetical protein
VKTIEDKYKDRAVRINCNGIKGSGCLFHKNESLYSYVFTARHCLINDGEDIENLQKEDIEIYRYKLSAKSECLRVVDYRINKDPDIDLAVIVIERVNDLEEIKLSDTQKDSPVFIYGYPIRLEKGKEPRENIKCSVSFRHEYYKELESNNILFSYDTSMPENIKGLSGAGVFKEVDNDLELVGIFSRLKAKDGVYNKLCAFNVEHINTLISNYEPIDIDDFSHIRKESVLHRKVFYLPYTLESEPYYIERKVDIFFNKYIEINKNIWLSGCSGVGKTNLITRNLKVKGVNFISFELSGLPENNVDYYLSHINNELKNQLGENSEGDIKKVENNLLDSIASKLLSLNNNGNDLILFVDEVPIYNRESFFEFTTKFILISEKFNNLLSCNNSIKWIISTRINPIEHLNSDDALLSNKDKARKNFNFKDLSLWEDEELLQLLLILEEALNFKLCRDTRTKIIEASSGKPGRLKDIIEIFLIEEDNIDNIIEIVKTENY